MGDHERGERKLQHATGGFPTRDNETFDSGECCLKVWLHVSPARAAVKSHLKVKFAYDLHRLTVNFFEFLVLVICVKIRYLP